ncbi:hypothetical protein SF23_00030 [Streptomyces sp. MBRL 10]|nr:hypothetical protein SF23_00030 [Streptomyces sp. MBRL 10]
MPKCREAAAYRIVLWRANPDMLPDLAPRTPVPNGYGTVPVPAGSGFGPARDGRTSTGIEGSGDQRTMEGVSG